MSKTRMAQALALVVVIVIVGAYFALLGSDDDADTGVAAEPTATSEPASAIIPEATPIAALTFPGQPVPFEDMQFVPIGACLHGDNLRACGGIGRMELDATPTAGEVAQRENNWTGKLSGRRLKLLVFAPGVDPLDQAGSTLSTDDERVVAAIPGHGDTSPQDPLLFSLDDERLIVVEEFAFCGDGRGIYLEHSTKPIEVGETFAWEIYVDPSDTIGDIHMVLIAAPDSPITHDGPDPKRLDLKWTPVQEVLTADVGVAIVGIIAEGGLQAREMCS